MILLSEIYAHRFEHPFMWDRFRHENGKTETVLFLRPGHVMDHLSTAPHLRAKFDALPIKTARVFKQQLMASGAVLTEDAERTIRGKRTAHLAGISLQSLERLGLYATPALI